MPKDTDQGTGIDPMTAMALIQSLASGKNDATGGGASPDALLKMLTSQIGDPNAAMLASLLMNGLDEEDDDVNGTDEEELDGVFAEIDRLLDFADQNTPASLADGQWLDESENEELRALREVNDTLASALGACSNCWGGEVDCPSCNGQGAPGAKLPDTALFQELILPAVRRVNSVRKTGFK